MEFDARKTTDDIIRWIRNWFEHNSKSSTAVIGISGGKDSAVTAALCARALGIDRVLGVLMPNGVQLDIDSAYLTCRATGIKYVVFNIEDAYRSMLSQLESCGVSPTEQSLQNLPARLRMSALYCVSQSVNGRVANTCNLSEDYVGYSTLWGDAVGDFSVLSQLTVTEVRLIGEYLRLPGEIINKPPSDGLCSKTDEENLGFTYSVLDTYIRTGICPDDKLRKRIDIRHHDNAFKPLLAARFPYTPPIKR